MVEGNYCNIFRITANALSKAFKTMLSVVETFDRVELGIQYQNAVKNRSHNLVIDHLDIWRMLSRSDPLHDFSICIHFLYRAIFKW